MSLKESLFWRVTTATQWGCQSSPKWPPMCFSIPLGIIYSIYNNHLNVFFFLTHANFILFFTFIYRRRIWIPAMNVSDEDENSNCFFDFSLIDQFPVPGVVVNYLLLNRVFIGLLILSPVQLIPGHFLFFIYLFC